ncbi:uncharacterized protein [Montipora foliosa]|uniref:uncharacterized protein n=1 Tax=Montipora foliosa TaxID=591990 RepID=UPI0035F1235E
MKFLAVLFCSCLILVSGRRYWHRSRNAEPVVASYWNQLTVTWLRWDSLPLTVNDALKNGWTLQDECRDSSYFRGNRYTLNGDKTVMLLFDADNKIAGLQTGITKSDVNFKSWPWREENDTFVVTAYFKDPSQICSKRSSSSWNIGDRLLLLNGTSPQEFVQAPSNEAGLEGSAWTEGQCVWTMGKLYWYDLVSVSDCNSLFPVFLMYTNEVLNGFGWILPYKNENPRFVHATNASFPNLFKNGTIPSCFWNTSHLSLMHVYLDSYPFMNIC